MLKKTGEVAISFGVPLINCIAIGITIGTRIDIVAHDVPVEKLIAAAVKNIMAGKTCGVRKPEEILTKYSAVPRSTETLPSVQAKTSTAHPNSIDFAPVNQAFIASFNFSIFLLTVIIIAIIPAE